MLLSYTNSTDMIQHFIDVHGNPIAVAIGASVNYVDQHGRPGDVAGLIVKVEVDGSGDILYIGYAKPGTAASAKGWAIKKRNVAALIETYPWAGGVFELKFSWDNRASLSYS